MKFFAALAASILYLSAALLASPAHAAEPKPYNGNKNFEELTSAEKTSAKRTARTKKLRALRVCSDPGNLPISDKHENGFANKIIAVLAKAMDTHVEYFWRPYLERGLTRETFGNDECDILLDMPADYVGLLTTVPIYRSTYVFAYRNDAGFTISDFDDRKLKDLRLGVFQHSGMRVALAEHGITENVAIHVISHNADIETERQPWRQVQDVIDGKLDIAGVWGPFAGFLTKDEPLIIQPANLLEDKIQLEFDMAIAMPKTDVVLKYMLDNALEESKDQIKKILEEYGVPLVKCSRCIVSGNIPSHGAFFKHVQDQTRRQFLEPLSAERSQYDRSQAPARRLFGAELADGWLEDGADIDQEFTNAVLASDRERVKHLLAKGAGINKPNLQGLMPLHMAARQRDSEMITLLLAEGADVNGLDADGWTPLLHAVYRNHVPSVEVLTKAGADIERAAPGGFTPLALAISEGKFFAVNALLDAGANVNAPASTEALTPLMLIASQPLVDRRTASLNQGRSSVDVGKRLIEAGADINATSAHGVTPLMVAAAHNNPPLIGLLIQSGADVDAKTPQGQTALDIAKDNLNKAATQQIEILAQFPSKKSKAKDTPDTEAVMGQ